MASSVLEVIPSSKSLIDTRWKKSSGRTGTWLFLAALASGLTYIGVHVARDLSNAALTSVWPYVLLGMALAIALGFEFVNGFHDTANAVATVIYTQLAFTEVGGSAIGAMQPGRRAAFFRNSGVCGGDAATG